MKPIVLALALLAAALPVAGVTASATLEVCPAGCAFSTIQAAVNAAAPGDTVLVRPGTYVEQVSWSKDAITLCSAPLGVADCGSPNPAATTIDGSAGTGVMFFGSDNVLRGFTVKGSPARDLGFGIFFGVGERNQVLDNEVVQAWDGIAVISYGVTADDNLVKGNLVTGSTFYAISECCGLEGNRFEDNVVRGNRAGFYLDSTGARLVFNTIEDQQIAAVSGSPSDARYNYWGSPLPPLPLAPNGVGLGYTPLDTMPWCLLEGCPDMKLLVEAGVLPP